jgi:MFS family permease
MRRVMLTSAALVTIGTGLTVWMKWPWELNVLWGVVVGLGTGAMANSLGAMVANRWFVKHRGLVTGILTASNATGQLIFLPLFAWIVVTFGWKSVSYVTASAALLLLPVIAVFMKNRPADVGLQPYGYKETILPPSRSGTGNPFKIAFGGLLRGLRSVDFWLLSASFFICGASTNGLIGTHLIPASMEHGIPEVTAASLLAVTGMFDIVGTTLSGWLTDRFSSRALLCWYYGLRGLSLLYLPYALGSSYLSLAVFIVFYGLDWIATVPPTVRLASDAFGKENVGVVYGWIGAAHQLGASFAAYAAGAAHTWFGTYQIAFISSGLLCLVASGLVIRIGRTSGGRKAQPALES